MTSTHFDTDARSTTPTILLTVDGSDKDERAIAVGAALAELGDAAIRVVRVFETPIETLSPRAAGLGVVDAAHAVRAGALENVRQSAERVGALVRAKITWDVIDGRDVAATLLEDLEAYDATFLVMATRAAGAAGRSSRGDNVCRPRVPTTKPAPVTTTRQRRADMQAMCANPRSPDSSTAQHRPPS